MPSKIHVNTLTITSAGAFTLTAPGGFGVPVGAIILSAFAPTSQVIASGISICVGAVDATERSDAIAWSADTNSPTQSRSMHANEFILRALDGTNTTVGAFTLADAVVGGAAGPGAIDNGWNGSVTVFTTPFVIQYALFGDVAEFHAQRARLDVGTVTDAPFQADALWTWLGVTTGVATNARLSWSFINGRSGTDENVTVSHAAGGGNDNFTLTLSDVYSHASLQNNAAVLEFAHAMRNFTAIGWDSVPLVSNGGSTRFQYGAIRVPDDELFVGMIDAPVSNAAPWTVNIGFQPKFAMLLPNLATALNSPEINTRAASMRALCMGDGDNWASLSFSEAGGAFPIDREMAWSETAWVYALGDGGQVIYDIAPSSNPFTATGWTVPAADINAAEPVAKQWPALIIGETGAPPVDTAEFLAIV